MAGTGQTLIDVAEALAARLQAALPDVPTVAAERPPRGQGSIKLPAVLVAIDEIEPLQEAGDSRLLADVRWQAHCLFDPNQPRAELGLRALAARVAVALHEIRRPVPGQGHVRLVRAGDDFFRPELDGYLCWVVEFGIEIALGELEPAGVVPSEVHLGEAPAIGADHEADYERIA